MFGAAELGPDALQRSALVDESLILLIHLIGGLIDAMRHPGDGDGAEQTGEQDNQQVEPPRPP